MVHRISLADADPAELASAEFDELLAAVESADVLDGRAAANLDFALRRRCLESLRSTRPSDELTELSRGISRILHPRRVAQLAQQDEPYAARWSALRDLVDDRLRSVQEATPAHVLEREHVRHALRWIHEQSSRGNSTSQADLREHLGLRKPNLTRLVTLMVEHGLLTRSRMGKVNQLALTDESRVLLGVNNERSTGRRGLSYFVPESAQR